MKKHLIIFTALSLSSMLPAAEYWTGANGIEMAKIGDVNNVANSTKYGDFGSISYEYSLSKNEVTVNQYLSFLNHVHSKYGTSISSSQVTTNINIAGTDTSIKVYTTYNNKTRGFIAINEDGTAYVAEENEGNYAINSVSAYAAAMYCNWLTNGATADADILAGVYDFNAYGATKALFDNANRESGYMLPTLSEWYKAAYYDGNGAYYKYANQSNIAPTAEEANIKTNAMADVGSFDNASFYGVYDLEGNADELLQGDNPQWGANSSTIVGSAYVSYSSYTDSDFSGDFNGTSLANGSDSATIRLAYREVIPEPSTYATIFGALALAFVAYRKRN